MLNRLKSCSLSNKPISLKISNGSPLNSARQSKLMWLLKRLTPDFKTIADFRMDNGKGIKNDCRQFVELCRQINMFSEAVVAIDGSKFKAVNAKKNNFTPQ